MRCGPDPQLPDSGPAVPSRAERRQSCTDCRNGCNATPAKRKIKIPTTECVESNGVPRIGNLDAPLLTSSRRAQLPFPDRPPPARLPARPIRREQVRPPMQGLCGVGVADMLGPGGSGGWCFRFWEEDAKGFPSPRRSGSEVAWRGRPYLAAGCAGIREGRSARRWSRGERRKRRRPEAWCRHRGSTRVRQEGR